MMIMSVSMRQRMQNLTTSTIMTTTMMLMMMLVTILVLTMTTESVFLGPSSQELVHHDNNNIQLLQKGESEAIITTSEIQAQEQRFLRSVKAYQRGTGILTVLCLCVLALCFVVLVFYFVRMERHARRMRELEMERIAQALQESSATGNPNGNSSDLGKEYS